jgi:hypothetical protein
MTFIIYILTLVADTGIINSSGGVNVLSGSSAPLIAGIIGAVISSLISGFVLWKTTKKNIERNARIGYISTLLSHNDYLEYLSTLIDELNRKKNGMPSKGDDGSLLMEVKKPWCLIFFSLSSTKYKEFVVLITNQKWEKALDLLEKYISGDW